MPDQRKQKNQQSGHKGGQQQAELDKKRKRWREIGQQQEEQDKKWREVAPGQEPGTGDAGT